MKYLNLLLIFLLITIYGCSSSDTSRVNDNSISQKGTYIFSIRDTTETELAEGTLKITQSKEHKIIGTYRFDKVYSEFPGYESMKGNFEGIINPSAKTLLIDTNPGTADDNVFFDLRVDNDTLSGIWYYSAFRKKNIIGKIALIKKY